LDESAATRSGVRAWFTRRQGYLFFPLLLLEGLNLHVKAITSLSSRSPVKGRWIEVGMLTARFIIFFGLVFWLLPFGMAWAFIGVQLAVFGLYMGATFAPNHKGMPIVPADIKLDFLSKQVRTSRNITGGWWAPVPEHAATTLARRSCVGPRALPQQRHPVRRDELAFLLSDGDQLSEPCRPRCARSLRLPAGKPAATWLTG
jgi:hypothetical protein